MSASDDTCDWAIADNEKTATPQCGYIPTHDRTYYMVGGKFLHPCPGCGLEIKVVRSFRPTQVQHSGRTTDGDR